MISYHPTTSAPAFAYNAGFKTVDTCDLDRVKVGISKFAWSPIVWIGGVRKQDNFVSSHFCVLDFDTPEMPLAEALRVFCDMQHIIGTTKSHQKPKGSVVCDRYRVVIPWDEPLRELEQYRQNMRRVLKRYPADSACSDGARFYYPCTEIVSLCHDGYKEEIQPYNPQKVRSVAYQKALLDSAVLPRRITAALTRVIPEGERNTTVYQIAIYLAQLGLPPVAIVRRILDSPTYKGRDIPPALLREIQSTTLRGAKRGITEALGVANE